MIFCSFTMSYYYFHHSSYNNCRFHVLGIITITNIYYVLYVGYLLLHDPFDYINITSRIFLTQSTLHQNKNHNKTNINSTHL